MNQHLDDKLYEIIKQLEKAYTSQNKAEILHIYDKVGAMDLDAVSTSLFEVYDEWVGKCNDLLYS